MYQLSSYSNEVESRCGFLLTLQPKGSCPPPPLNPAFVNSQESVPLFLQENHPSTVSRRGVYCGKILIFPRHSLQEALLVRTLNVP